MFIPLAGINPVKDFRILDLKRPVWASGDCSLSYHVYVIVKYSPCIYTVYIYIIHILEYYTTYDCSKSRFLLMSIFQQHVARGSTAATLASVGGKSKRFRMGFHSWLPGIRGKSIGTDVFRGKNDGKLA